MGRRNRQLVKIVKRKDKPSLVLRWIDPETGRYRERATDTRRRRDAERLAADLEAEITANSVDSGDMLWDRFRTRYEDEHLAGMSLKYRSQCTTSFNALERLHGPQLIRLGSVTSSLLSRFGAALRDEGKPPTTIAAYLRCVRAAMNWAAKVGLITQAPAVGMPRRARGVSKQMRSRPILLEEFEIILMAVPRVRNTDAARWVRFLTGLWESGLRVGELLSLTWEPDGLITVDTSQSIPMLMIKAEGQQKKHADQFQPITPEFWNLINVPVEQRRGPVFSLPGKNGQMTVGRVIRTISRIGEEAGIITQASDGKFATSHDIGRRPFTVRLGRKGLSQMELAEWMRHRSPQTTMQYYHAVKAEELASRVWPKGDPAGDLSDNTPRNKLDSGVVSRIAKER